MRCRCSASGGISRTLAYAVVGKGTKAEEVIWLKKLLNNNTALVIQGYMSFKVYTTDNKECFFLS